MSNDKQLAARTQDNEIQVLDVNRVKDAMEMFSRFKREVLTDPGDTWEDKKNNNKRHVRKPGWEKYSMALNISTDFSEERSEVIKFKGQEILAFHFRGRAVAPNGRYAERAGSASSDEGRPWCATVHGIRAMAQTRAVLRAISALVGGGELTAEELDTRSYQEQAPVYRPASQGKPEDLSWRVKRESESTLVNAEPESSELAEQGQDAAVENIKNVLKSKDLDPNGVEVRVIDWGFFEVVPSPSISDSWREYDTALKAIGAVYHKASEPQYARNWTIKVKKKDPD